MLIPEVQQATGCMLHVCAGVAGISSFHAAVGGTSVFILPMLFIQSFKRLSWLSMVGFVSTMVVTGTMLVLVAVDPLRKHMPSQVRATTPVLLQHILAVRCNNRLSMPPHLLADITAAKDLCRHNWDAAGVIGSCYTLAMASQVGIDSCSKE